MRRSSRSGIPAALALLIGLLVVACGSTEPLPSSTPRSEPAPAASSSGAPGETGARAALSEFEGHVRDATTREGQLVRALATASTGSAAEMRLAIGQIRQWVDGEKAWLAAHPADACYDSAATKLSAAIEAMASSAGWLTGMVDASLAPSDDVSRGSMGTEAGNDLQDATQALTDAAALAKAARAGCG